MTQNEIEENEELLAETYFLKPNFVDRIKSIFIDSLVIVILLYITYAIINRFGIESSIIKGILFVLIFLYEPILVAYSRTVGQKLMNLKIYRQDAYIHEKVRKEIGIFKSIVRYFFKFIFGWISLLTVHSDNYGRAIHDKIVKSIMVRES